ncbi:MAG: xylulokinase [Treponemataceae bacterium]|nr:xylulokinase [Treponemataceae bacterium]
MKTTAGIDLGTQSMKVVLYDWANHKIVEKSSCPLELISENDGTREQKTEWYDAALKTCFDGLSAEGKASICAIGVSGQQHGFVPLDKDGKALYNIKLWNDTSTVAECKELTEKMGGDDAVVSEVCNLMLPGFTAPKILWLKNHKPDAWANLRYIMLPHDYINYKLTGAYTMEYGDASGMALFDGKKREWSKKACDAIDEKLYGLLPALVKPNEKVGSVSKEAAALLGIPEGIPVSAGGGDNMMGAIGTGTVSDGFLTMSMGTSGTLYGYSDKPIADPQNGLSGFCSSSGGWLPLLCTMNCTVATEFVRDLFGMSVKELDAAAAKAPAGSNGVLVMPFFNGERTPNLPNGRASITGLTAANTCRENIARASLESAVFAMRGGLDAFRALGFEPKEIRLIGGGSKSPLWRQIAADILNLPIRVPALDEAAALGAAVQALWCLESQTDANASIAALCAEHISLDADKSAEPDPAAVAKYNEAYADYQKVLAAVAPLYC